jgi:tubulin polyglutamylase TTLL4
MEKPEKECAELERSPNENFADKPLSKKRFSYEIKHMTNSPYKISIKKNNFNINNASELSNLPSQNPDHLPPSLIFISDDLYDPVIKTESLVLKSESYNNTRESSAEHVNKTARRLKGNTFNKPPRLASNPIALYNQTQTIFRNQQSNHIITGSAFNKLGNTTNKPNPNTNQTNNQTNNYYHNHLYQKARNTYTSTQFQLKRNFVSNPPNPNARIPTTANSQAVNPGSYTDNFINRANQMAKNPQKNIVIGNSPHATTQNNPAPQTNANRYTANPLYIPAGWKNQTLIPNPSTLPNPANPKIPGNHNIRVTSLKPHNPALTSLATSTTYNNNPKNIIICRESGMTYSAGPSNSRNYLYESNETIRDSGFNTTMYKTGFRVTDNNFYTNASHYEDGKNWESDLIGRGELIDCCVDDDHTRLSGDSFDAISLDSDE